MSVFNFTKTSNFAVGTLNDDIDENPAQNITITSPLVFPDGDFIVVIWGSMYPSPVQDETREIVKFRRMSPSSFNIIERGLEDTVPRPWPKGSKIANVITAGKIKEIENSIGLSFIGPQPPQNPILGTLWVDSSDQFRLKIYVDGEWRNILSMPHTHSRSDIVNFQHTHTKSDITDFEHSHEWSQAGGPDYTGYAGKYLRVKPDSSGLEWADLPY